MFIYVGIKIIGSKSHLLLIPLSLDTIFLYSKSIKFFIWKGTQNIVIES